MRLVERSFQEFTDAIQTAEDEVRFGAGLFSRRGSG
jgi:hypothetical protein